MEGWAARVKRLASHYGEVETDAFVRDFAFIYAAIPTGGSWLEGALAAIGGPPNDYYIHESNDGLATEYIDSLRDWQNQSHHYAGLFYLGYFGSQAIAETVNCLRDCGDLNFGDINLGITGARDGAAFNGIAPNDLVSLILNLSEFTP